MAFIITRDYIRDPEAPAPSNLNAAGIVGPGAATETDITRLKAGEGAKFRLLDGDGAVYYHGRWIDSPTTYEQGNAFHPAVDTGDEFEPLDCFGYPNAGCSEIQYKHDDGTWHTL